MDRREVLKGTVATAGVVGVLGVTYGPSLWKGYNDSVRAESLKGDIAKLKAEIIARNSPPGRSLELQATEDEVTRFAKNNLGQEVQIDPVRSLWVLKAALHNLKTELEMYPAQLVQTRIKKIVLMERSNGQTEDTGRNGFAVPDNGEAFIGIPALLRAHFTAMGNALPRVTAHHELGHVFLGLEPKMLEDWAKLNSPDFAYAIGIRIFRNRKTKQRGFADAYGETSVVEDMATVFERMMLEPTRFPHSTDPGDDILATKVQFIKERLKAISPEMDDAYWARLAGRRN